MQQSASAAEALFSEEPGTLAVTQGAAPGQKRARTVVLNPNVLNAAMSPLHQPSPKMLAKPASWLRLNFFPDATFNALVERTEYRDARRFVAHGSIEKLPGSLVLIAANDGALAATVFVPGRGSFKVLPAADGQHEVVEVDADSLPQCGPELAVPPLDGSSQTTPAPGAGDSIPEPNPLPVVPPGDLPPPVAGDFNYVDVMVVYTDDARVGAGGTSGINALIDLAIAEANTCYANSEINARLNLVHTAEISYTETGNANTDLTRLASTSDGQLDAVHSLRTQYGADIVSLFTESMASYAGLGYVMSPPSSGFASYAFNVVRRVYATGQYVFAHEVGHNLGCAHDRQNSSSAGAYSYSYGYRFYAGGTQYRTVMAYAPGARIPYFSNPNVSFNSAATGVASGATAANNALSINNTAPVAANFRGTVTVVSLASATRTASETDGDLTFTVTRSGTLTNAVTLQFATANGTALAGSDYVSTNGTLTFASGETTHDVTVPLLDNGTHENSETFQFRLTSPIGASLGTGTTTVTITDDDRSSVSFASANRTVTETNLTYQVPVTRSGNTNTAVSVRYATVAETATATSDFTAFSGTLSFAAGETSKTLNVTVKDDTSIEANEVFHVRLSSPVNTGYGSYTNVKFTIRESDRSIVRLSASTVSVSETAGGVAIGLRRDTPTNNLVTVRYATVNGTALAGTHFTATSGTVTFLPGVTKATVIVPITNNELLTGNKSFSVKLTHPYDATISLAQNTITILDDEVSYVSFTLAKRWVYENSGAVAIALARTGSTNRQVSVRYATANGTALAGSDYNSASGTVTFAAGETSKTFNVTMRTDAATEPNESFFVRLSNPVSTSFGSFTNLEVVVRNSAAGDLPDPLVEIASMEPGPDGRMRVSITGPADAPFVLQAAGELPHWFPLVTNVLTDGTFAWEELDEPEAYRYFRVVAPAPANPTPNAP